MQEPIVGHGLCECGCGETTNIARRTYTPSGVRAGEHFRFMVGHRSTSGPVAFWSHVHKTDGCWTWTGARTEDGYGTLGKTSAHRSMYETHVGPIPDGMMICHTCDNPPCVNPAHLFLGINADNMEDMARKARSGVMKLTPDQVREVRAHRSNGMGVRVIAERYGVSHSLVSLITTGKIRKTVEA